MENLNTYISISAVVISLFGFMLSRRQLYNNTVTINRMKWISDVRQLVSEFIECYLKNNCDKSELSIIKYKIDLYFDFNNDDQKRLSISMNELINNNNISIEQIVSNSQAVLANSWKRIKLESKVNLFNERMFRRKIYK